MSFLHYFHDFYLFLFCTIHHQFVIIVHHFSSCFIACFVFMICYSCFIMFMFTVFIIFQNCFIFLSCLIFRSLPPFIYYFHDFYIIFIICISILFSISHDFQNLSINFRIPSCFIMVGHFQHSLSCFYHFLSFPYYFQSFSLLSLVYHQFSSFSSCS